MKIATLNLLLLIIIVIMLFGYLFIRIFFTSKYLSHQVPIVNSGNDVISNLDLSRVVKQYQVVFQLQDYELKYDSTESFYTLDKGLNKFKKTITFSKPVFSSVGYELDYLLATMWFISQKVVHKNKMIKAYSFINRFGFNINLMFLIVFGLISLVFYILVEVTFNGTVDNSVVNFLWNIPIFQILAFLAFLNSFIFYLVLLNLKPKLEAQFGHELGLTFNKSFPEYKFDLSAARNYATQVPLPHNFTFKTITNEKFKWLGPFIKY